MPQEKQVPSYFGIVAKVVDHYSLVINKGSEDGVSIGDRFQIYGIGEEVIDPESGISLGKLESVRGTGKVSHVQPKLATISCDQYEKAIRKVREIKRNDIFSALSGNTTETVHEEDGNRTQLAFAEPEVGDRVRPI
jgi:hypothetical protein